MRLINLAKRVDYDESLSNIMSQPNTIINVLTVLGCKPKIKPNGWIEARCPDHVYHAGHQSSHYDKWNCSPQGFTKCFTGNCTSNIIKTLEHVWNISYSEVIERLKHDDYVKVELPVVKSEKHVDNTVILSESLEAYNKASDILTPSCLSYFDKDGITEDTLKFLGVKQHGDRAYIPFYNEDSTICGYVAVYTKSKEEYVESTYQKMRKIDNSISRESIENSFKKALYARGFKASEHLYGMYVLNFNRNRDIKRLVIVEGERDAMKLLQEGIDCVSIHGTSLKEGQLNQLLQHFPIDVEMIVALDGDEAGKQGASIIEEKLNPYYTRVKVLHLHQDPKKFNGEEFNKAINK